MEVSTHTIQFQQQSLDVRSSEPVATHTQSILSITLNGPALILTVLSLVICIHFLHPSLTTVLIALAPVPCIVHNDFKNFLSLGPGGTPSTFAGYIKITYLRFFALSDPYTPPPILGSICPETGCLQSCASWLPERQGPRPLIAGIAPQRQLNQFGCPKINHVLRRALENVAQINSDILRTDVSCFEKNGLALFARHPLNNTCNGEIVHVHYTDRSFHLNIHPLDAKIVLAKGWGQRHPLAKGGWLSRYVPKEFVMIYAPRNLQELEIVLKIIEAAAWWVMGEKIEIPIPEN